MSPRTPSRRHEHRPRRSSTLSAMLATSSSFDILTSSLVFEAQFMVPDTPANVISSSHKTSHQHRNRRSKKASAQKAEPTEDKIPFYLQSREPPPEPAIDLDVPINHVCDPHQEKPWGDDSGGVHVESDILSYSNSTSINNNDDKVAKKGGGGYRKGRSWFFRPKPKRHDDLFVEESSYYTCAASVGGKLSGSNDLRRWSVNSDFATASKASSSVSSLHAAQTGMFSMHRIPWPWSSSSPKQGAPMCMYPERKEIRASKKKQARKYKENPHPLPRETATWQGKKKGYTVWREGDSLMRMGYSDGSDVTVGRRELI